MLDARRREWGTHRVEQKMISPISLHPSSSKDTSFFTRLIVVSLPVRSIHHDGTWYDCTNYEASSYVIPRPFHLPSSVQSNLRQNFGGSQPKTKDKRPEQSNNQIKERQLEQTGILLSVANYSVFSLTERYGGRRGHPFSWRSPRRRCPPPVQDSRWIIVQAPNISLWRWRKSILLFLALYY